MNTSALQHGMPDGRTGRRTVTRKTRTTLRHWPRRPRWPEAVEW